MRNTSSLTIGVLVGFVAIMGCAPVTPATPNSLRAAKGTGLARVYPIPLNAMWNAVPPVLADLKLKYLGEDKQAGYLLAESDLAAYGRGELVVVFIDSQDHSRKTRIEVISKKVTPLLFASDERNWAAEILDRLDATVKRLPDH